ncbi:MAG: mannose-6-phosphate isomerase [Clostridia bacterium]|nr:mannose-6-phosphate isomerase [Clostridia bacterium]
MLKKYPMKLRPVTKEILWGGDRLKQRYHKHAAFDKLAETWELTVRPDGMSIIDSGDYTGMSLEEFINHAPRSILGTNGIKGDRFPILIKFIDARDDLSIQVHPDDSYALANEGELGKMEMWYIVEATDDARLVYGLKDGCTMDAFAKAVAEGRTESVLQYVPVKAGECYFIPSGQVHAIGSGCLIAEIQQNSNVTYRVYDYNRKQADDSLRQLHVAQALDVVQIRTDAEVQALRYEAGPDKHGKTLCNCQYFKVKKHVTSVDGNTDFFVSDKSFKSVLVLHAENAYLEHEGTRYEITTGDSFFLPAGMGSVMLTGDAEVLVTTVN